jgi:hypothetical protein
MSIRELARKALDRIEAERVQSVQLKLNKPEQAEQGLGTGVSKALVQCSNARELNTEQNDWAARHEHQWTEAVVQFASPEKTRIEQAEQQAEQAEQEPDPVEVDASEREAIAVELGGVPEVYAQAFAAIPAGRPADIPRARWDRFIDDAGRFLDQWGREAERLGWHPEDLLGLHPVAPLARYDRMGLLWMAQGVAVVRLTDRAAELANKLVYYRRPNGTTSWPPRERGSARNL